MDVTAAGAGNASGAAGSRQSSHVMRKMRGGKNGGRGAQLSTALVRRRGRHWVGRVLLHPGWSSAAAGAVGPCHQSAGQPPRWRLCSCLSGPSGSVKTQRLQHASLAVPASRRDGPWTSPSQLGPAASGRRGGPWAYPQPASWSTGRQVRQPSWRSGRQAGRPWAGG